MCKMGGAWVRNCRKLTEKHMDEERTKKYSYHFHYNNYYIINE